MPAAAVVGAAGPDRIAARRAHAAAEDAVLSRSFVAAGIAHAGVDTAPVHAHGARVAGHVEARVLEAGAARTELRGSTRDARARVLRDAHLVARQARAAVRIAGRERHARAARPIADLPGRTRDPCTRDGETPSDALALDARLPFLARDAAARVGDAHAARATLVAGFAREAARLAAGIELADTGEAYLARIAVGARGASRDGRAGIDACVERRAEPRIASRVLTDLGGECARARERTEHRERPRARQAHGGRGAARAQGAAGSAASSVSMRVR